MTSLDRRRRWLRVIDWPKLLVDYAMAFAYAGKGLAGRVTGTAPIVSSGGSAPAKPWGWWALQAAAKAPFAAP